MEVTSEEFLWKASCGVLLCFLVATLVSFLFSFSSPSSSSSELGGYNRISTVDLDHQGGHKKKQIITHKKRVKFVDQEVEDVFPTEKEVGFDGVSRNVENEGKVDVFGNENEIQEGWEWEGVEMSELEVEFGRAKDFVETGEKEGRFSSVGNDVIMQLYGLEKVAIEGPCHEPQPMALKLNARAKWNAWQRLGNMIPEQAMEKYIALLSDIVPGWKDIHSSEKSPNEVHSLLDSNTKAHLAHHSTSASERTKNDALSLDAEEHLSEAPLINPVI